MVFSPLEQFEIFPLVSLRFGSLDLSFTNSSLLIFLSIFGFSLLVLTCVGPTNG